MANSTIIYACSSQGLVILNKPGTSPDWLPPRTTLAGQQVESVWADPGPPIRVLAVTGGALLLSENGGRTWKPSGSGLGIGAGHRTIHLMQGAEPPLVYLGIEGGRLASSSDGGATWESFAPLPVSGAPTAVVPPMQPSGRYVVLVREEAGGAILAGSPEQGDWARLPPGGVLALAQDAGTGQLYISLPGGIQVSADSGLKWVPLKGSPADASVLVSIPGPKDKPPALLAGSLEGLQISPDGGATWQRAAIPETGGIGALARDPERRDRVYAAAQLGYLFESGDRGRSWERVNATSVRSITALFVVRI